MDLNENRRKARSLLTYFEKLSGKSTDGDNQIINFYAAKESRFV